MRSLEQRVREDYNNDWDYYYKVNNITPSSETESTLIKKDKKKQ